jgi:hypothetical protein
LKEVFFLIKNCKNSKRLPLVERNYITAWRANSFREIKKNDEFGFKRNMFYSWSRRGVTGCVQVDCVGTVTRKGSADQHRVIVHADSDRWFVPGAYLFLNQKQLF